MTCNILLYIGSIVITLWGIFHIIPTRSIVKYFGSISQEKQRILTMEWIGEGLTLCFIGILVLYITLLTKSVNPISTSVYRASAVMLLIMAIWTGITGARTSIIPIKICPIVKTIVGVLFILGSIQ